MHHIAFWEFLALACGMLVIAGGSQGSVILERKQSDLVKETGKLWAKETAWAWRRLDVKRINKQAN